jgi:hypothetical protein
MMGSLVKKFDTSTGGRSRITNNPSCERLPLPHSILFILNSRPDPELTLTLNLLNGKEMGAGTEKTQRAFIEITESSG